MRKLVRNLTVAALGGFLLTMGGHALANGSLPMLGQLEKGQWTLTERGETAPRARICLGDPAVLLTIEHRGAACSRYVIENKPDVVTVQYRCQGRGHGHTTIRHETNRVVQMETQGILNGQPFDRILEARRVGSCR